MLEPRDVLERIGRRVAVPQPAFERLVRRRSRKRRHQRIAAGAVAVAVFAAAVLAFSGALNRDRGRRVAEPSPLPANGWVAYAANAVGPDGKLLDGRDIYVAREGEAHRIVGSDDDGIDQFCPAYSPDGSMLAYSRSRSSSVSLVVTAVGHSGEAVGTERRLVTTEMAEPDLLCASWSPVGRELFYRDDDGNWIVSPEDGTRRQLAATSANFDLAWAPDGSALAGWVGNAVVVVPADGSPLSIIPAGPASGGSSDAAWSPDGRRILVATGGKEPRLRTVRLSSGRVDVVDLDGLSAVGAPAWSPDGQRVAFERDGRIVVVGAGGGDALVIPKLELPGISGPQTAWAPRWAPDGRHLLALVAFHRPDPLTYAVVSMPIDGSRPSLESPLTFGLYFTTPDDLDWQPISPEG